ncbi:alpha/beta hydrolase [Amycolatopsis sp. NPDC059021]|uniref:alpha/beta hydrolase n=1 Tax=Amycolatopsis sp. NPDC059021 TaxID=3346704 RepID=UPI0036733015
MADVLGPDYETTEIPLGTDDEGEVLATLVTRRADPPRRRAVLYVHGFVDYFFQSHLADFYLAQGFDFYALDLRKYGRSLRPHQTPNFVTDLTEYFPEIDEAVRIIRAEHDVVLLNGHSTGGLVASLWAGRVRGRGLVQGLFLNSPFFELPEAAFKRVAAGALAGVLRRARPMAELPAGVSPAYAQSLHHTFGGEWDFDLTWKPVEGFPVRTAWLAAIHRGQRHLRAGLDIDVPVLVMISAKSVKPGKNTDIGQADAVLNVTDIARRCVGLGPHLTLIRIDGGLHDLVLSPRPVREHVFTELTRWLKAYLPS